MQCIIHVNTHHIGYLGQLYQDGPVPLGLTIFLSAVEQPPTITAQSEGSVVAFAFDDHFTLKCEATGNPKPV